MSGERNQNLVKLFHLVRSLSKREKQQFWSYIQGNARKVTGEKYVRLFERLAKIRSLKGNTVQKEIFSNDAKALNDSCRYLVAKIIECLAFNSPSNRMGLVMIDKSIEKGFVKLASKLVRNEFQAAADQHDIPYLRDVYERRRRLKKYCGEDVKVPKGTPTWVQVLTENYALAKSDLLYQRFVESLPSGSEKAIESHLTYKEDIENLGSPFFSPQTQARIYKVKALWASLKHENQMSAEFQDQLIKVHNDHMELFPPEQRIDELRTSIILNLNVQNFDVAESLLLELGSMELESEVFENFASQVWIQHALTLAACDGRLDIGKVALAKFEKENSLYSSYTKGVLTHIAALVAISLGQWETAREQLRRLSRSKNMLPEILLELGPALRSIVHYHMGEFLEAQDEWKKLHAIAEESSREYLKAAARIIRIVTFGESSESSTRLLLAVESDKLNAILEDEAEADYAESFNIEPWLYAQISGISLHEVLTQRKGSGMMLMRMSS